MGAAPQGAAPPRSGFSAPPRCALYEPERETISALYELAPALVSSERGRESERTNVTILRTDGSPRYGELRHTRSEGDRAATRAAGTGGRFPPGSAMIAVELESGVVIFMPVLDYLWFTMYPNGCIAQ